MTTIDVICAIIICFFGAWKMMELADVYAPKAANWLIAKIEGRK